LLKGARTRERDVFDRFDKLFHFAFFLDLQLAGINRELGASAK